MTQADTESLQLTAIFQVLPTPYNTEDSDKCGFWNQRHGKSLLASSLYLKHLA